MKKTVLLAFVFAFLLASCSSPADPTLPLATTSPEVSSEPAAAETVPAQPAEPEHSAFYIPGTPVEDVILYFNEVCLDAEFVDSGNPYVLQKWRIPICYRLYGTYTESDVAALTDFVDWLNSIEGFPGIRQARDGDIENLHIHFCDAANMIELMGDTFSGLDGAVTFWYDFNEIYDAVICCRTDIDQYTRNSVILEELYNGLGPIQDTSLRQDSIIYSGFSEPQKLSQMDELLLKLLYHPQLSCGMDAENCEAMIRQLYY